MEGHLTEADKQENPEIERHEILQGTAEESSPAYSLLPQLWEAAQSNVNWLQLLHHAI